MAYRRLVAFVSTALLTLVLAACGGGGSGGEISPSDPPVSTASGADTFLLFPNPQKQPDGSLQTNYTAYAQAYYAAIDPTNAKDSLAKWKAANGFDTGTGTQVTAVFGDSRDLGYGRRMTARVNPDGTIAFLVENYLVNPGRGYGFSTLSLDAAVVQDTRWRALVNAIEFSPGPGGTVSFAKFFNFDPSTGQRQLSVDLDGRGAKAMPGPCVTCHGGRGDALTPPDATGRQLLGLVQNSATRLNGAEEAVSGALQKYQRAWITGSRSFGKGTAQRRMSWEGNENVYLYATNQRFFQPTIPPETEKDARTNQGIGIFPDFATLPNPNPTAEDLVETREEDLFENALPALSTPWTQPRPEQAQKIADCAAKNGIAKQTYESRKSKTANNDYRLLVTQDLFNCAITQ